MATARLLLDQFSWNVVYSAVLIDNRLRIGRVGILCNKGIDGVLRYQISQEDNISAIKLKTAIKSNVLYYSLISVSENAFLLNDRVLLMRSREEGSNIAIGTTPPT